MSSSLLYWPVCIKCLIVFSKCLIGNPSETHFLVHLSSFSEDISHKQDTSLEFYEFQYQMISPHSILTYLHLATGICHGILMVATVVMPSCVVFVFLAFLCCAIVPCQAGSLFNLYSSTVTTYILA